jgi:hypothetical protein
MKMRTLYFVIAVVLLAKSSGLAQTRLMRGAAERDGSHFFFDTVVQPAAPIVQGIGGGVINGNRLHRIMVDSQNRTYFGYDITMEPLPEQDTYRVTFGRLSVTRGDLRGFGEDLPQYVQLGDPGWGGPAVRTVRAGEVLTLDLLINSSTGQKIVDYITVQRDATPPARLGPLPWDEVEETGVPRDFQAHDAFIDLDIKNITIDGQPMPGGGVSAAVPYMAFADHGRFILSLAPRPEYGFRLAGVIRGSTLGFTINGHTVELVSARRIAPGSGPFNLYVLHQRDWEGREPNMVFGFGGVSPGRLPRAR